MWPKSLGIDVSRESIEKLEIYHALLLKWQKAINLVSPKTLDEAWMRHFADSAQLAPFVSRESLTLFDIGSGAGFPGLVLSIICPNLEVHLIESDERKCQFLRTVSRETNVDVTVHNSRIESVDIGITPDFVSARALADLGALLDYCLPWIKTNPQLECLFMKGARASAEIEAAHESYDFECESVSSKTDPEAGILHLGAICPKTRV